MKFIRKLLGIICLIEVPFGVYMLFNELKDHIAVGIFTCAFFAICAYLLLRKKKVDETPKTTYMLEVPSDTLEEMKSVRRSIHADNLIRIINESYSICIHTTDLSTFESRLELATQKAYTLKEMEIAGLYNCEPTSDYFLNILIGKRSDLLNDFLLRAYNHTITKANQELKTQSGIQNRIAKFISKIENSALDFDISILPK